LLSVGLALFRSHRLSFGKEILAVSKSYSASDIEVLSGLEPVRRRPGMYTDTSRPNHLAHEVVDNSVDEAISGHCQQIDVILYKDGSLQVADDGRGMPVDKHPKEKIPGVELILTRLHAGGKFSGNNYQYSGGLHGVGVSVVNALSKKLEVWIRRDGKEYNISFAGGKRRSKLAVVGKVGKKIPVPPSGSGRILSTSIPKIFLLNDFSMYCVPRLFFARA
jgi:topoisomerase-4 subunit B